MNVWLTHHVVVMLNVITLKVLSCVHVMKGLMVMDLTALVGYDIIINILVANNMHFLDINECENGSLCDNNTKCEQH